LIPQTNPNNVARPLSPLLLLRCLSTILLGILILANKPTHPKRIRLRPRAVQERQWRERSQLRIIRCLQQLKPNASSQVIPQRDTRRQVRARVQRASAFAAIEGLGESVFENPVGASGGVGEASRDAVASAFDAVFEVEVHFGDDARDVDAFVV